MLLATAAPISKSSLVPKAQSADLAPPAPPVPLDATAATASTVPQAPLDRKAHKEFLVNSLRDPKVTLAPRALKGLVVS
jgi:hypothetical protein